MSRIQFKGINVITILLCLISIFGIWYLYLRWKRNIQHRNTIRQLLSAIQLAVKRYDKLTNFSYYFSNFKCKDFLSGTRPLSDRIPGGYRDIGLGDSEVAMLNELEVILKSLPSARAQYNDTFVSREIEKYKTFFSGLEAYPLSREQMEAVVRDEDHNLVIAGAGTGKTTTISAKVAYLLEKGLAVPEDLLIISFTNSAVDEMAQRCNKFCGRVFSKEELEVKTFNAFGYMVNRSCATTGMRLAFDGKDQQTITFLAQSFKSLFLNDEDFMRKATNFIAFFNRPHRSEFSFSSKDEYLKYEKGFPNVTLDGRHMKSGQEVAKFLVIYYAI
jgi:DNA helicase-4